MRKYSNYSPFSGGATVILPRFKDGLWTTTEAANSPIDTLFPIGDSRFQIPMEATA